jgi:hypothetical protein
MKPALVQFSDWYDVIVRAPLANLKSSAFPQRTGQRLVLSEESLAKLSSNTFEKFEAFSVPDIAPPSPSGENQTDESGLISRKPDGATEAAGSFRQILTTSVFRRR